ncbi:MAG: hypothetical protein GY696_06945 [Gammaproteobacteria bacterium]|nr:hypothetical protein [Gammaproteobacteria bacterium]
MNNSIDAWVEFSFKGKFYKPKSTIDLDRYLEQRGTLPPLHGILATENGIDTYSYLYEVMEQADVQFDNPRGVAEECLVDGHFDIPTMERRWREYRVLEQLQTLASLALGVDDLEQNPELKQVLVSAYELGRQAVGKSDD